MSDLPTPITREEQFLNGIAQGNTSDLPTPITREEEYLNAIAKSGGGGSGDGDMKKSVYDSNLAVANAGGISAFVSDAISGKVDKVAGKGLSTNDYDNTEKGKVADNTAAIEAINENGCCNIYPPYTLPSTLFGLSVTNNADGSFTIHAGTSTNSNNEVVYMSRFAIKVGTYKASGGVSESERANIELATTGWQGIYDSPVEVNVASDTALGMVLVIYANATISTDLTFKPMLYDARLKPTGYVPYAMTNRELTERVTQSEFVSIGTDGVKTQKQLMQDLYALVDLSKISMQSKLVLNNANSLSFFSLTEKALDNRFLCFMRTAVSSAVGEVIETYQLGDGPAYAGKAYGGTEHETSSEVLSAGMSFTVYY